MPGRSLGRCATRSFAEEVAASVARHDYMLRDILSRLAKPHTFEEAFEHAILTTARHATGLEESCSQTAVTSGQWNVHAPIFVPKLGVQMGERAT